MEQLRKCNSHRVFIFHPVTCQLLMLQMKEWICTCQLTVTASEEPRHPAGCVLPPPARSRYLRLMFYSVRHAKSSSDHCQAAPPSSCPHHPGPGPGTSLQDWHTVQGGGRVVGRCSLPLFVSPSLSDFINLVQKRGRGIAGPGAVRREAEADSAAKNTSS